MLVTIESLTNTPVMSLQTGAKLAETTEAIIDPRQLVISSFYVEGAGLETNPSVLHPDDIREISDVGLIVDDADKLTSLDGLVRLQQVIDFNFSLIGLKVVDEHKRKLGKVSSYSVDTTTFTVAQIYTEQTMFRSLSSSGNTINRSQIISVSNDIMVVQSPTVADKEVEPATIAEPGFINPFRGHNPQPDSSSVNASRMSS